MWTIKTRLLSKGTWDLPKIVALAPVSSLKISVISALSLAIKGLVETKSSSLGE
jgi:hypothetical protein